MGQQLELLLQHFGSVIYLLRKFVTKRKSVWQEVISSKKYKKENINSIIKNILKVSIPITLCALFSAMTKTIDAVTVVRILKNIIGEDNATIQYGILSGKVDTLIMLPFSFNIALSTALIPSISGALAKNNINSVIKRIKFSILITLLIGIPCTVLMSLYSNELLSLLFPKALQGSMMLKYSSLTIIFVLLTQTINGALQGMGRVNIPVIAFAIGALIKLVLNLVLITRYEVIGAIYSSIISRIVIFLICFIELKRNIDLKLEIYKYVIKPLIASFIMYIITKTVYLKAYFLINQNIKLIVSFLIGILIYIICIIFLKTLSKDEVFMFPYGELAYKKLKKINIKKRV